MDPYFPVERLRQVQPDLTRARALLLKRFDTPLTEKDIDFIHMALLETDAHITHLTKAMDDPEVKAKFAK